MKKFVFCICEHCHCKFAADTRHPNAHNCGKDKCRREVNRKYANAYYRRLKNNPKAYGDMLERKKRERPLRKARAVVSVCAAKSAAEPAGQSAVPVMRPVSSHLAAVLLRLFVSIVPGGASFIQEYLREHLKEAAGRLNSPALAVETEDFLSLVTYLKS